MVTKMSRQDRAKQFMPFSALKGYAEALQEKEKITAIKTELSPESREELDYKLKQVTKCDIISVTYFHKNEYVTKTGMISEIDQTFRTIKLVNIKIPFDDIYDIIIS